MMMTKEEALIHLGALKNSDSLKYHPDLRDAVQVGINTISEIRAIKRDAVERVFKDIEGKILDVDDEYKRVSIRLIKDRGFACYKIYQALKSELLGEQDKGG
jgi:hypothetical protein